MNRQHTEPHITTSKHEGVTEVSRENLSDRSAFLRPAEHSLICTMCGTTPTPDDRTATRHGRHTRTRQRKSQEPGRFVLASWNVTPCRSMHERFKRPRKNQEMDAPRRPRSLAPRPKMPALNRVSSAIARESDKSLRRIHPAGVRLAPRLPGAHARAPMTLEEPADRPQLPGSPPERGANGTTNRSAAPSESYETSCSKERKRTRSRDDCKPKVVCRWIDVTRSAGRRLRQDRD